MFHKDDIIHLLCWKQSLENTCKPAMIYKTVADKKLLAWIMTERNVEQENACLDFLKWQVLNWYHPESI